MTQFPARLYNEANAARSGLALDLSLAYNLGGSTVDLYTIAEAARELGVTVQTIKNYLKRRELIPTRYVGRMPVFDQAALDLCRAIPRHAGGRHKQPKDDQPG
jgi:hypothetical protein